MMVSSLATLAMALALGSTGGLFHHDYPPSGGRILPPGPGNGWGFPNGNPDGYGWYDVGTSLPLGADRTPEYYFPRYDTVPGPQLFMPTYYNSYVTRGQRFIPFTGCGGWHPAGGPPSGTALLPVQPSREMDQTHPMIQVPKFHGNVEADPINPGGTGLTP